VKGNTHRRASAGMVFIVLALFASACSTSPDATSTSATGSGPGVESTAEPTTTTVVATTQPIVIVDARFAVRRVVFGEQGWIELVNTGPQAGNVHGLWIAIHPFYLELPPSIVEVGQAVVITLGPETGDDVLVEAAGLLPVLAAPDGEIALYSNGNFGDPDAIVDYLEWGSGGHFRSTVAEAAGIWDETRVVTMRGDEGGLLVNDENVPQPLDADLSPMSTEG